MITETLGAISAAGDNSPHPIRAFRKPFGFLHRARQVTLVSNYVSQQKAGSYFNGRQCKFRKRSDDSETVALPAGSYTNFLRGNHRTATLTDAPRSSYNGFKI